MCMLTRHFITKLASLTHTHSHTHAHTRTHTHTQHTHTLSATLPFSRQIPTQTSEPRQICRFCEVAEDETCRSPPPFCSTLTTLAPYLCFQILFNSSVVKRDLDTANMRSALEHGCGKQTPSACILFFLTNLLHVRISKCRRESDLGLCTFPGPSKKCSCAVATSDLKIWLAA